MSSANKKWNAQLVMLVLIMALMPTLALAANNPGHDTLYIEQDGNSTLNGSLNITTNLTVQHTLYLTSYLDLIADGTTLSGAPSRNTIIGTNSLLEIDALSGGPIYLNRWGGTVYLGTASATTTLNVSGPVYIYNPTGASTVTIGGQNVCLANGTGCPSALGGANITGTGTANYVTKWSGTSTVTNSMLFDNSTHVGLNTILPTSLLHVNGTLNTTYLIVANLTTASCDVKADASGNLYCGTDANSGGGGNVTGGGTQNKIGYWLNGSNIAALSGANNGAIYYDGSGNVQSGTLPVLSGGTGTTTSTGTGSVVLSASPTFTGTAFAAHINTTQLTVNSLTAGSCDVKAYDNGTLYCGTDAGASGVGNVTSIGSAGYIAQFHNNTEINNSVIFQSGSNIGIGTQTPGHTLTVAGSINISSASNCLYLPGGGRLCGNTTCSSLYSPDGGTIVEACN